MPRLLAAFLAASLLLASAQAQDDDGRYALVPLADGLMRLDKRTGEVSQCTDVSGPLTCRLLPDERMAYQAEIDRLSGRLDAVEREIAAIKESRGGEGPAEALPSDEELDRYMSFAEQMMRRFFDMVKELKRQGEPEEL